MREEDAVDRAIGGDRELIDDRVDRVAQKFETGNKRDIEFARGKLPAKRRRMIEMHRATPAVDERPGVEIFDATDAKRSRNGQPQAQTSSLPPPARPGGRGG